MRKQSSDSGPCIYLVRPCRGVTVSQTEITRVWKAPSSFPDLSFNGFRWIVNRKFVTNSVWRFCNVPKNVVKNYVTKCCLTWYLKNWPLTFYKLTPLETPKIMSWRLLFEFLTFPVSLSQPHLYFDLVNKCWFGPHSRAKDCKMSYTTIYLLA